MVSWSPLKKRACRPSLISSQPNIWAKPGCGNLKRPPLTCCFPAMFSAEHLGAAWAAAKKPPLPEFLVISSLTCYFLSFLFEFSYLHIKTEACYVVYICAVYVFIFLLVSGTSRPHYAKSLMN